jgi:hypothetical protein
VDTLVLPDSRGLGRRIEGYDYHASFPSGTLWRPELDRGGTYDQLRAAGTASFEMYFVGEVVIKITELGRGAR